ncbi:Carnitine O-palmitoyltransferase 2, mitochondrial [Trichoplax sp. H2]|nr:Carnitine O-palmitoyltransferase 2, mitochondrial [Trichoplax sp. H2]|eukprot:RDD38373.1 Carnitine O-palmitoyltransferase 2, mitochondrial [Trichoplax sp. H2]
MAYSSIQLANSKLSPRILRYGSYAKESAALIISPKLRKSYASAAIDKELDDGYLHHSVVPTMHYQPSLPRLPIPSLEKTCMRYLNGVQPLLSAKEFEQTSRIVKDFEENEGKALHKELVENDKKNKHTSYIAKPWMDMYLSDRTAIPINYNPGLIFLNKNPQITDQALRATGIIYSSLRFMRSLETNKLTPDIFHLNPKNSDTKWFHNLVRLTPSNYSWYAAYLANAYPLDMSQYKNLFKSTRIPKLNMDYNQAFPDSNHILVMKNGRFYTFNVIDPIDGSPLPPAYIYAQLRNIAESESSPPEFPINFLTTENRDTWANLREELEADELNAESLKAIDSAILALCLDDVGHDDPAKAMLQVLHGNGYNRWFDKSFQIIVNKKGEGAMNFEHAWGDGVAVMRYVIDMIDDSSKNLITKESVSSNVDIESQTKELQFNLSENLKSSINVAKENFVALSNTLESQVVQYEKMNKNYIKEKRLSPDSLAYYRMTGQIPTVYESCSTAAFKHGRTECLRSVSMLTKACCEAFGQGFDRHLFALRVLAASSLNKLPDIFLDPTFSKASHFTLSTSTLGTEYITNGGFGPVVKDGLGLPYMVLNDFVGVTITSYEPKGRAQAFADSVKRSLDDIYDVLNGKNFKSK